MNCSGSASDLLDVSLSQSEKCDNPTNSDIIKMIAEEEKGRGRTGDQLQGGVPQERSAQEESSYCGLKDKLQ